MNVDDWRQPGKASAALVSHQKSTNKRDNNTKHQPKKQEKNRNCNNLREKVLNIKKQIWKEILKHFKKKRKNGGVPPTLFLHFECMTNKSENYTNRSNSQKKRCGTHKRTNKVSTRISHRLNSARKTRRSHILEKNYMEIKSRHHIGTIILTIIRKKGTDKAVPFFKENGSPKPKSSKKIFTKFVKLHSPRIPRQDNSPYSIPSQYPQSHHVYLFHDFLSIFWDAHKHF